MQLAEAGVVADTGEPVVDLGRPDVGFGVVVVLRDFVAAVDGDWGLRVGLGALLEFDGHVGEEP